MMIIPSGSVVLVPFPFTNQSRTKTRPAVVISNEEFQGYRDDIIILGVSSKTIPGLDIEPVIEDWKEAGLRKPSVFKASIATLRVDDVISLIGELSKRDRNRLTMFLTTFLAFYYSND